MRPGVTEDSGANLDGWGIAAILRTELAFFIRKVFATISPGETYLHNWHVDAIAHQLMRVHSGEGRRLLINQPPRSLKSICVSVAYVAWLLGHDPTRRVIVARPQRSSLQLRICRISGPDARFCRRSLLAIFQFPFRHAKDRSDDGRRPVPIALAPRWSHVPHHMRRLNGVHQLLVPKTSSFVMAPPYIPHMAL